MRLKAVDRYVNELSPKLEAEYMKNRKDPKYDYKKTNFEVLHKTSEDLANKVYNDSKGIILLSTFSAIVFLITMAILKTTETTIVGMSAFTFALFMLVFYITITNKVTQRLVEIGIKSNLTNKTNTKMKDY